MTNKNRLIFLLLIIILSGSNSLIFGQQNAQSSHCMPPPPDLKSLASLPPPSQMTGIGKADLKITTKSKKAQIFFNQGLSLYHCFWWNEALRAFNEAIRLDPQCAMAYWGIYKVLTNPWGGVDEPAAELSATALEKAHKLSARVSQHERAYIEASYQFNKLGSEKGRDIFTEKMKTLIAKYPNDIEAKLLLAIFLFQDNFPHGFDANKQPTRSRKQCMKILSDLLRSHPDNAAVNHYWIHAIEGSSHPEAALESAKRMAGLAPKSGHMIHMAGHIYFRIGDYEQARQAFLASMKVDEAYIQEQHIEPMRLWNYTHNLDYLARNCAEEGRFEEGVKWAKLQGEPNTLATFFIRCGRWGDAAELFDEQKDTQEDLPEFIKVSQSGFVAFIKGMAFLEKGKIAAAIEQSETLEQSLNQLMKNRPGPDAPYDTAFAEEILSVAILELRGTIKSMQGDHTAAIALLQKAWQKEQEVGYEEPPQYARPVVESLAEAYLRAEQWKNMREAFQQELIIRPNSGYALFGIARSFALAGEKAAAKDAYQLFLKSWHNADSNLPQIKEANEWLKLNGQ